MAKLSWSKWTKYKILRRSNGMLPYLPETYWMKEPSFWLLLDKFGEVIVKPSGSYGGHGVLLIKSFGNIEFEIQEGPVKKRIRGRTHLFNYLRSKISKNYIVQRRISLASVKNRPFDLRVMVQRRNNAEWQVTGKLAKVAGKGYIITNMRRSNGVILPVKEAIESSELTSVAVDNLLSQIDQVALLTAKQLTLFYPTIRTIGIDMGVDTHGHVWIIEANFKPMNALFRKLKDKSMYREIISYRT